MGSGVKVLSLQWQPTEDVFGCALRCDSPPLYTKRGVLSMIARIFDPLGLFSPGTFYAKHIMQRTWLEKLVWDEPLPHDIQQDWTTFVESLPSLRPIRIPRFFNTRSAAPCLLLGFCDASQHGYAAVIYLCVLDNRGDTRISLVGSKTKLAPIKPLTIPRLELNAAELLARWLNRVKYTLDQQLHIVGVYAWTDSTIVLSWLVNRYETFKVYVSNRVHRINSLLPGCIWSHVSSADNPADCASRGVLPSELASLTLYWEGPSFLRCDPPSWPVGATRLSLNDLPEVRVSSLAVSAQLPTTEWFDRFSSYDKLLRVVARILRFIHRFRSRVQCERPIALARHEVDAALRSLVIELQQTFFKQLLHELNYDH